ncbi:unnamed protein product [Parnassius apollo]|uniref:(apollo) hypothetical protein n=1 Tax=Parnassius apollo TaxID=110799 RepID=A0A8S3Y3T2_PARAO|nr:unnamed protein product [Parnassius apollo]
MTVKAITNFGGLQTSVSVCFSQYCYIMLLLASVESRPGLEFTSRSFEGSVKTLFSDLWSSIKQYYNKAESWVTDKWKDITG